MLLITGESVLEICLSEPSFFLICKNRELPTRLSQTAEAIKNARREAWLNFSRGTSQWPLLHAQPHASIALPPSINDFTKQEHLPSARSLLQQQLFASLYQICYSETPIMDGFDPFSNARQAAGHCERIPKREFAALPRPSNGSMVTPATISQHNVHERDLAGNLKPDSFVDALKSHLQDHDTIEKPAIPDKAVEVHAYAEDIPSHQPFRAVVPWRGIPEFESVTELEALSSYFIIQNQDSIPEDFLIKSTGSNWEMEITKEEPDCQNLCCVYKSTSGFISRPCFEETIRSIPKLSSYLEAPTTRLNQLTRVFCDRPRYDYYHELNFEADDYFKLKPVSDRDNHITAAFWKVMAVQLQDHLHEPQSFEQSHKESCWTLGTVLTAIRNRLSPALPGPERIALEETIGLLRDNGVSDLDRISKWISQLLTPYCTEKTAALLEEMT